MTKISLCMIVKNEESLISNCLTHIQNYVHEIIIIDTGSTDNTKKIACEFTNHVYDFSWCNDFAKARNFSLLKSNNDWVLVLDADEIVSNFNSDSISRFIQDTPQSLGRIARINHLEESWGKRVITERINRFFNKQFFHYEGIIHEQIVHRGYYNYNAHPIDITIDHIGYNKDVINIRLKVERNITLLYQAISANPNDPYLHYQLGKSYYLAKEYDKACKGFRQALSYSLNFNYEYVEDLIESYGYALINNHQYIEALDEFTKYDTYYTNSPDYRFLMGLIYMNAAQFSKAVESFMICTSMPEGKAKGINSYLAFYNIGVIYEILGFKKEAIQYYQKCGNYKLAQERLSLN